MANYFKITDVKIFPCAYRGQNINPEASSFTEYNFTNIYSKQGKKKESFIISYTENELKFGPILLKKKPEAFISYYNRKMDLLMRVMDTTMDPLTKMQKQKEINDITSAIK